MEENLGVFGNILDTAKTQSEIGKFVCIIILMVFSISTVLMIISLIKYRVMIRDLKEGKEKEEFRDTALTKIYEGFKDSVFKGTENINTEVLIEKNILNLNHKEQLINYSMTLVILLGLLGTFIGLTGAISEFFSQEITTSNIAAIMKTASKEMSTAFITSIVGMSASVILNIIGIYTYRRTKQEFYDELEDYLDNYIFSKYSSNLYNQFLNMKTTFEKTMDNMASKVESSMVDMSKNVERIFEEGIASLGNKINNVTIDLKDSSMLLDRAIRDMNGTIELLHKNIMEFNEPVNRFKASVDNFEMYYNGLDIKIENFHKIIYSVVGSLENVAESLNEIIKSMSTNNEHTEKTAQVLVSKSEDLMKTYRDVEKILEEFQRQGQKNHDLTNYNISNMEMLMNRLLEVMASLRNEVITISTSTSKEMSKILVEELREMSTPMTDGINKSLNRINKTIVDIENTLYIFADSIKSQGRWIEQIDDIVTKKEI